MWSVTFHPVSRIGIDVAVLDIAQDFLLAHLAERGVLGELAIFKGGTALRKLFTGAQVLGSHQCESSTIAIDPNAYYATALYKSIEQARRAIPSPAVVRHYSLVEHLYLLGCS